MMGVVPDHLWVVLFYCYANLKVQVRWQCRLSHDIPIKCGTKQGGLTSPFVFYIFYKGLVQELQDLNFGVRIENNNYNFFCYTDEFIKNLKKNKN